MIFRALFLAAAAATIAHAQNSSSAATATSGAGGASTAAPTAAQPSTVPVSLHATNPSAVPLSAINSAESYHATSPLDTTYAPGSEPTIISNAPPVPTNYMSLDPKNYPPLDQPPPENSPEVDQWMQEVMASGITIPDISATLPGGCETNPSIIGNATRCWWTCGQCTTPDDITTCPTKMTWGLSFDDGPSPATPQLLDYLDSQNLKSTFFIVGSRALSRPDILLAEYEQGHQLSVHTWSHTALTTQTTRQIVAELGWTAKVIRDITGVTPNTMRPPYGDIDNRVRAIALAMGFTPIIWTGVGQDNFDTEDWHIAAGTVSASEVIEEFDKILTQAPTLDTGFIVLSHDLYQQSVDLATGYILPDALARQPAFTIQPIITCLNKPLAFAYKETNDDKSNPPPGSSGSSPTGTGSASPSSGSSGAGQGQPGAASLAAAPAGLITLGLALLVSLMSGAPFA